MTDITSFINTFIDSFISILTTVYDTLSNITFGGISLLSYVIALFVLGAAVPLVISLLNNRAVGVSYVPRIYRNGRNATYRKAEQLGRAQDELISDLKDY